MIRKFRDISIIELDGRTITVACDSCSGVGGLSNDLVEASGYITGYRTAFVALAETLSLGAKPILITNTLSISMNSYGKEILRGIAKAAHEAGLSGTNAITGSTEDNFNVPVTSLGVTVIGELNEPLPQKILSDCKVYLAGLPKLGADVLKSSNQLLNFNSIKKIKSLNSVYDLIPVGSKGIGYELGLMQEALNANFEKFDLLDINLSSSAGPATCAIFAALDIPHNLQSEISIPLTQIGVLKPK
jgi:hypothetical protein